METEKKIREKWTEGTDRGKVTGRKRETRTVIRAEKQINRDRDGKIGPGSQTQEQRDSDDDRERETGRVTMAVTGSVGQIYGRTHRNIDRRT